MARGLESRRSRLLRSARRMSTDLVNELRPAGAQLSGGHLTYERMNASASATRPASGWGDGRRTAPLVGELTLTAGKATDAREVLDEAMHALRKIESGGVHGDRVA
jgi:hypothetical protein